LINNVIEGEINDGKAEPVMLATSFEEDVGIHYEYNVEDKMKQDTLPPSAILIEKLPKNGKILTTNHDGSMRELKTGEIVETELMKNFRYDQGEEVCSSQNKDKCQDSFTYSTMSSWVGTGIESESEINLTPLSIEESLEELDGSAAAGFELSPHVEKKEVDEAD